MHDQTSNYFAATQYACETLHDDAPRYFVRLHDLSRHNSLSELKSIVDGWRPQTPAPNLWVRGSAWGSAVRVERNRGIFWKLQCSCGKYFDISTNDTIPEDQRKCATCRFADELSAAKTEAVVRLEQTSAIILAWHRAHDKLIWNRVHKALRQRSIVNDQFARDLHALCWVKISERASQYQERGFKPSAWLGRVADNVIRDYFKVEANRARLAPTVPLASEEGRDAAAPPTKPDEVLPAKSVRPEGASPHDGALNEKQSTWDQRQDWNG